MPELVFRRSCWCAGSCSPASRCYELLQHRRGRGGILNSTVEPITRWIAAAVLAIRKAFTNLAGTHRRFPLRHDAVALHRAQSLRRCGRQGSKESIRVDVPRSAAQNAFLPGVLHEVSWDSASMARLSERAQASLTSSTKRSGLMVQAPDLQSAALMEGLVRGGARLRTTRASHARLEPISCAIAKPLGPISDHPCNAVQRGPGRAWLARNRPQPYANQAARRR